MASPSAKTSDTPANDRGDKEQGAPVPENRNPMATSSSDSLGSFFGIFHKSGDSSSATTLPRSFVETIAKKHPRTSALNLSRNNIELVANLDVLAPSLVQLDL